MMAWTFADSFDFYANNTDYYPFYWDSGLPFFIPNAAGRFVGHAMGSSAQNAIYVTKNSNINDPVHHIVFAFKTLADLTDNTLNTIFFQLNDGATAQCTVTVAANGSFKLLAGAFGTGTGTVLATSPKLIIQNNVWYAFEVEVAISNTNGSFTVRMNGNPVNDYTISGLNTRSSANNYANSLSVGSGGYGWSLDDFFWQSGATTGNWLGDIRCYTRMPVTDVSVQFTPVPANVTQTAQGSGTNTSPASANTIYSVPITMTISGKIASLIGYFNAGITGNVKMALYDSTGAGGGPGSLIAQTVQVVNPVTGANTFTFTTPPVVQNLLTYYVAIWSSAAFVSQGNAVSISTLALTYTGTFPATMVGFDNNTLSFGNIGINITVSNAGCVGDVNPQFNTSYYSSYVWDNVPGEADFYNISTIPVTPAVVYAVTTRAYIIKSDAGTRTMNVQLKSGSTIAASPTIVLTTSGWMWAYRIYTTDPVTGAAWTAAAVNGVQIGPRVVA